MNIFQRIFKSKEKTKDQLYLTHQNWVFWLTGGWLFVTFEHIYHTLSQYSMGTIWMISGTEIPISDIMVFALVILLEVTLFWSVMFIPASTRLKVKKYIMYAIQGIGIAISMFLNIKYMIMASPTTGTMDVAIGAVIGGLIPIFVVLFGYVEGQLVDSQVNKFEFATIDKEPTEKESVGDETLTMRVKEFEKRSAKDLGLSKKYQDHEREDIVDYKKNNPHLSIREIAEQFNIPQEDVQKHLDEGRQYETKSNDEVIPD